MRRRVAASGLDGLGHEKLRAGVELPLRLGREGLGIALVESWVNAAHKPDCWDENWKRLVDVVRG